MQHKEDLDLLTLLAKDFSNRVAHFDETEQKNLCDWFDNRLRDAFETADKNSSSSSSIDFSPEELASFLSYLRASQNLTKCNYKELCAFSRSLTLLSTPVTRYQYLTIALVSAALSGQAQLLGKVPEMFLSEGSWCFAQLKQVFPDIKSLPSLSVSSQSVSQSDSVSSMSQPVAQRLAVPSPNPSINQPATQRPTVSSGLPRHPKAPSYFHHYKEHLASVEENKAAKKGRHKK